MSSPSSGVSLLSGAISSLVSSMSSASSSASHSVKGRGGATSFFTSVKMSSARGWSSVDSSISSVTLSLSSMVSKAAKGKLMASANSLSGVNETFLWPGISISSPVPTLTLFRASTSTTLNVPSFFILTFSPDAKVLAINENNSLRNSSLRCLEYPVDSEIALTNSGNVIF